MYGTIQNIKDRAENNMDMFHDITDFPICSEWQTNKKIKYEEVMGNPLCYEIT